MKCSGREIGALFYCALIDLNFADVPIYCGSGLAREGGLPADLSFADRVHIHCCGNGGLWFRPYGDSLFYKRLKKEAKNARPERTAPR